MPERQKEMVFCHGMGDILCPYTKRIFRSEFEQKTRKQLFEFLRSYMPIFRDRLYFTRWYRTVTGFITEELAKEDCDTLLVKYGRKKDNKQINPAMSAITAKCIARFK